MKNHGIGEQCDEPRRITGCSRIYERMQKLFALLNRRIEAWAHLRNMLARSSQNLPAIWLAQFQNRGDLIVFIFKDLAQQKRLRVPLGSAAGAA